MSDRKSDIELTVAQRIEGSLSRFFLKWGVVIAYISVVVLIAAIALVSIGIYESRKLDRLFNELDLLEHEYQTFQSLGEDDESYAEKREDLLSGLDALASDGKGYPALKARYLLGTFAFGEGSYQDAIDHFGDVYRMGKGTYFQSLALANAAASAENMGDVQRALEYYTRIIDEFGFEAAEAPKALFAQGRLEEGRGNTDLAKATFQQLADQFPNSEYAKLALNRIAFL
ncbi:MAG: tetratricopeptide repeat protein [Spirochaetales bacterium]|nr:tetratricopeptide repeat protein [Spirochaetales bacterium]